MVDTFNCSSLQLCLYCSTARWLLGRPDLDLFEAHYFLAFMGRDYATLKRKWLNCVIKDSGQAVLGLLGLRLS